MIQRENDILKKEIDVWKIKENELKTKEQAWKIKEQELNSKVQDIQCHQRNHKETTDRSWLEEPTRPLRRLPLTPHHRQCRLDFCRPRATWSVTDWDVSSSVMNPDSVSVLMTTAHVSGGAAASGPIRHLLSSGIQQFHKV
ncbi:hypothetical protein TNCV_3292901 [Trichonephila clavipes]|nr:hypothetical protein TNCV_3292901 [Trichonephila clavipes]